MKYRVTGNYSASITVDVLANSEEEAVEKAKSIFECADPDDFNIQDEINIDVDAIDRSEAREENIELMNILRELQ